MHPEPLTDLYAKSIPFPSVIVSASGELVKGADKKQSELYG